MTDERMLSNGNVRLRLYSTSAFANFYWPTVAELNAGLAVEDAVPWDGFDFGMQASDTGGSPPVSAKSVVQSRTTSNYGGGIPFWYPGYYDDAANLLSNVYDFWNATADGYERTQCIVAVSVDGEIGEASQPASTMLFADGDFVSLYRVRSDSWDDSGTVGDDPFFYALNFIRNGGVAHYTVASTAAPVVVIPTTLASAPGDVDLLPATVNGRPYNGGLTWTTSDAAVATVSDYGVVTSVSAGSATITATTPRAAVSDTTAVTVT